MHNEFKKKQWGYIKNFAQKYNGKKINNIIITPSGMLGAAHLLGQEFLFTYLKSNGSIIPKDDYGTSIEEYLKKFGGYDISKLTGLEDKNISAIQSETNEPQNFNQHAKLFKLGVELQADIDGNHIFTPQEIGELSPDDFEKYLPVIEKQLKEGLIQPEKPVSDYSGYINPISGGDKIFSREAISKMSLDEYSSNEKEIFAQMKAIGIPTDSDLHTASVNGGTIYVRPYTRKDGTEVSGYYRSA